VTRLARRARDVDLASRSQLAKIVTWSFLGGVIGALLGVFGSVQGAWGAGTVVIMAALGWAISFVVPLVASSLSGRAAQVLYAPSGATTPHRQGHSQAESLVARGMFDQAIEAFEVAIARDSRDARPYLELARLHRDRIGRYDAAAFWFKRALREATLTPGEDALTRRELVELYVSRMDEPGKAAPVLARMADELSGTPAAAWAEAELARIRTLIAAPRDPA